MNWGCPHLEREQCGRLRKLCHPTQKGCVLHGQVRLQPTPVMGTDTKERRARRNQFKRVNDERGSVILKTETTQVTKRRKIK